MLLLQLPSMHYNATLATLIVGLTLLEGASATPGCVMERKTVVMELMKPCAVCYIPPSPLYVTTPYVY